ncbi:SAM-dependent methyltransferase, partial [Micromonospora zhanjiangensis]
ELAAPGTGLWRGTVRVEYDDRTGMTYAGPAFRWARLGTEAIHDLAGPAGLRVRSVRSTDGRWFAELVRP